MHDSADYEQLLARINSLEDDRRYVQNALESVLSAGDFQKDVRSQHSPEHILKEAQQRIRDLLPFEASALYLVDEDNSDFLLSVCEPDQYKQLIESKVESLIDNGFFGWALGERRGVLIESEDLSRQFFLHVISTQSRTRGMFVGLFSGQKQRIPEYSNSLLSIILLNTANALESIELYRLLNKRNDVLESKNRQLKREINERTAAAEALQESEEKYRFLIDHYNAPISVYDRSGGTIIMNQVAAANLGGRPEDFIGKRLTDYFPDGEYYFERHQRLMEKGEAENFEDLFDFPSGKVWYWSNVQPLKDENGRTYALQVISHDITTRKQAEEDLQENEKRLNLALDATQDGLWDWDLRNKKVYTSERFKELIDFKGDDASIKIDDWSSHIHPDHIDRVMRTMQDHMDGKKPYDTDYLFRHNTDEEYHWQNVRGIALFDEKGKAYRMVGAIRDINERKQSEQALKTAMEYFQIHSDLANTLIKIPSSELGKTIEQLLRRLMEFYDLDRGNLIYWPEGDTESREIYSCHREGTSPFIFPDHPAKFGYLAKKVMEGDIFLFTNIHELPPEAQVEKDFFQNQGIKSGINIPMMVEGTILGTLFFSSIRKETTWSKDIVQQLQLIGQNFTHCLERKRAEVLLKESEDKLRVIFENVNDEIVYLDSQANIIDVNRRVEDIFGYKPEELIGKHISEIDFYLKEDMEHLMEQLNRSHSEHRGNLIEVVGKRKDGEKIHIEASTRVIKKDGEIKNIVTVIRDITQRKKLETRLQQAQKMEAIGALAGGVAHDLNNILSGLVSYPELLLMNLSYSSPLRKPISTIKKSGEKAASIVNDLLTLARRGVVVTEVVNMNDVISEYLESPEHEKLLSYHPYVTVKTDLEADLSNILGSPVHLSKTIMNLVSNAAEAMTGEGSILISTKNWDLDRPLKSYDSIKEGEYVALTVADTGEGISPKDLERIFEPFYTKKVMGRSGTGLGMAVVWGTVKDHEGYIDIETAEGKGTAFTLYFPMTRKKPLKDEPRFPIEEYMGNGESVLVVDDVEEQREIATELLKKLGYTVTAVPSGEQAVDYMKNGSADLLVLDMIMDPGIDGLETYKRIIEMHPRQRAIIASGFSETEQVKEAQKLGAGKYVKKPYAIEQLGMAARAELEKT